MPEVHVLFKGYYLPGPPVRAVATTALVLGKGYTWVVDPGTAPTAALTGALSALGLAPDDVDTVFLTHGHMDHIRNTGLFTLARVLDAWGWWEGDTWREFDGILPPGLSLLPTPGHSSDMLTLLVDTPAGRVAICGDVFYDGHLLSAEDPFAEDFTLLLKSRREVLRQADKVIPGHGGLFRI